MRNLPFNVVPLVYFKHNGKIGFSAYINTMPFMTRLVCCCILHLKDTVVSAEQRKDALEIFCLVFERLPKKSLSMRNKLNAEAMDAVLRLVKQFLFCLV